MRQVLQIGSKKLNLENWEVYHPDGKHMFTTGERRAEWYLLKKLAKKIGDKKIQLTFEPKGYGFKDDEIFGLVGRKSICVVTGISIEEEGLQRHHIVPYCYRRHFPDAYKTKSHHDVVLVTYKVHQEYENHATKYKNELAKLYNIKNLNEFNVEYTKVLSEITETKLKSISKLHSLFKSFGKMPANVIVENLQFVSKNLNIPFDYLITLNYIQLFALYLKLKNYYRKEFETLKKSHRNEYDHGYHLVKKLDTDEKIENFIKLWRKHFITTMKPKFMPEGWSVDFRCKVNL